MNEATLDSAIQAFREHDGILRTKEALDLGIHPRTLYRMRDDGLLDPISRGVFRLATQAPPASPDLLIVALRVPSAVVCLVSAAAHHDITTEVPHEVQITLPRGTRSPRLDHPPLQVFRFSGPALSEGVEVIRVEGRELRVYSVEKTVVDCFRFRNRIGTDVAIEALNLALKRKGARPADLLRYARLCRVQSVMLPYIEALQ